MPTMDGWRGVAILVVVLHNAGAVLYGGASLPVAIANVILTSGWVGVQLFFVLSGFLITGILLDSRGTPGYFRRFYIRRTLRIFPLYYGFLAVALIVGPSMVGSGSWTDSIAADAIWYWLYLSNWTPLLDGGINGLQHLWSLAAEEQFYLLWPTLVVLSGRRFPLAALGIVVLAPAARVGMYFAGLDLDYLYHFTVARADAFAIGALLALTVRKPAWAASFRTRLSATFAALSAGLLVVVGVSGGFGQYEVPVLFAGQSLISLWFATLMFATLAPAGRAEVALTGVLSSRWLRGFGKYSYAIYVLHFPLHAWLREGVAEYVNQAAPAMQLLTTTGYALAILAASSMLAFLSWHGYEKHFLRLKERWAPRASTSPTP